MGRQRTDRQRSNGRRRLPPNVRMTVRSVERREIHKALGQSEEEAESGGCPTPARVKVISVNATRERNERNPGKGRMSVARRKLATRAARPDERGRVVETDDHSRSS